MVNPLTRPIFVIGAPHCGHAEMLASLLAAPGTWDAGPELAQLITDGEPFDAAATEAALTARFDEIEHPPQLTPDEVRMVGACAGDPGAVGVLTGLFDDASFVFMLREPARAIADAAAEAASGTTPADTDPIQGYRECLEGLLAALQTIPPQRWCAVAVEDLVAEPEAEIQRVFDAFGLGWHQAASDPWRAWPTSHPDRRGGLTDFAVRRLAETQPAFAAARAAVTPAAPSLTPETPAGSLTARDRGLSDILARTGCSLLVSTYQTNRLIALRRDQGRLGVHLRMFDRPMGIAVTPGGFALGVRTEVLDYRNFPAMAGSLEPKGSHDACYLPRNTHVTGDIAIHDLDLGTEGLWLVATSFSCLATLDTEHSFVPRWRPPFITALAPEDRCHLNGLALVDGAPRYVTALGVSDTPGGWRPTKADGGVIIEVTTNEVILSGLSMPHSPRWHDNRLWFLESGRGRLSVYDPETSSVDVVAELPGFTRGLRFHDHYAFVGTSQIRETATFGGLPISQLSARECGVWAVDTRTGEIAASMAFEDRVQEIFDLAVLDGVRFPEVAERDSDLVKTTWLVPSP